VGRALDRLRHRLLERALLVPAAVLAPSRGQPRERPAEVQIGNLQETREGHAAIFLVR
jgi:hypothetical protein